MMMYWCYNEHLCIDFKSEVVLKPFEKLLTSKKVEYRIIVLLNSLYFKQHSPTFVTKFFIGC